MHIKLLRTSSTYSSQTDTLPSDCTTHLAESPSKHDNCSHAQSSKTTTKLKTGSSACKSAMLKTKNVHEGGGTTNIFTPTKPPTLLVKYFNGLRKTTLNITKHSLQQHLLTKAFWTSRGCGTKQTKHTLISQYAPASNSCGFGKHTMKAVTG